MRELGARANAPRTAVRLVLCVRPRLCVLKGYDNPMCGPRPEELDRLFHTDIPHRLPEVQETPDLPGELADPEPELFELEEGEAVPATNREGIAAFLADLFGPAPRFAPRELVNLK